MLPLIPLIPLLPLLGFLFCGLAGPFVSRRAVHVAACGAVLVAFLLGLAAVAVGTVLTLVLLILLLSTFTEQPFGSAPGGTDVLRAEGGNLGTVAMTMFHYYLLPFELVSVLLLVAMVGAVVLARFRL